MKYFIEFEHDSKLLGINGKGFMLVEANFFEQACDKIKAFYTWKTNEATGYNRKEYFTNARNFIQMMA